MKAVIFFLVCSALCCATLFINPAKAATPDLLDEEITADYVHQAAAEREAKSAPAFYLTRRFDGAAGTTILVTPAPTHGNTVAGLAAANTLTKVMANCKIKNNTATALLVDLMTKKEQAIAKAKAAATPFLQILDGMLPSEDNKPATAVIATVDYMD